LESLRFLLEVLCSSKWFLNALRRTILPLPVARNRFAAALRVLSLGMMGFKTTQSNILLCFLTVERESS
jgi:hypothetical protein